MKGLFSGRQIKDLKSRSQKITRSQTASSAYAAIMGKYGSIQDNAHYYHLGKGNWHKYSLENDRKRTGKLAESKAQWAERPNKFDWQGIDTKVEGTKRPKRSFSVSNLRASAPVGRQGKAPQKFTSTSKIKKLFVTSYNFKTGQINDREEAAAYQSMNSGNLSDAKKHFVKAAQWQMKDAPANDPRIERAYKTMQKKHAERMLSLARKEYQDKRYFGSEMAFRNYWQSLHGETDTQKVKAEWQKTVVGSKFKLEHIRQNGLKGRKEKVGIELKRKPVVKQGFVKLQAQIKKPKTLKELNIRIEEITRLIRSVYDENRKPTPEEVVLIKEANALIKKRDGIRSRQDTLTKKKEEKAREKFLQGATAKAAEARAKPSIKITKGYSFANVKKLVNEPTLTQNQLVILRDIERMFKLDDSYSRGFLVKHGYYVDVEDPYATGMVPKSLWLRDKISYRIDNPVLVPPSKQQPKAVKSRKSETLKESASSRIAKEGYALEEKAQNSQVNAKLSQVFTDRKNRENTAEAHAKVREWALTPAAQAITPKASFLVYDFLTGRYENTFKDLDRGNVTKQQVYKILGKIGKFGAMPRSTIANYTKRVKDFKPKSSQSSKLSLSSMKAPSKPSGRKTSLTGELNGIKVNSLQRARKIIKVGYYFREGFTWKNNSSTFKIVSITGTGNNKNIKYVNVAKPDKKYVTSEKDLTFDMQMNKEIRKSNVEMAEREAEYKKKEVEHQKKLDEEYRKRVEGLEGFETTIPALRRPKVIEVLNRFIRNNGHIRSSKDIIREQIKAGWVVEKQTWETSRKIRGERIGTKHTKKVLAKGDVSLDYVNKTDIDFAEYLIKKWGISTPKLSTSMIKLPSKLSSRTNKVAPGSSHEAVTKAIAVQGKYRYASFMRPLGSWFNPGTPFKIETVTASDRDFRYNRAPHSVVSTGSRLSEETLKQFELVDLAEGKKLQELIKYARSFDFLNDSMKGQLEDLILKGKGKAEIDKYIEKGRKMAEKKAQKPSSSSLSAVTDKDMLDNALTAKSGYIQFVADLADGDKIRNSCKNTKEFIKFLDKSFHNLDQVKRIGVIVGLNPEHIIYYPSMPYKPTVRTLSPLQAHDKARALDKKAEQMQKELHAAMENIPAGQGYHNVTDRNRLDKFREKQAKITAMYKEAEQLRNV